MSKIGKVQPWLDRVHLQWFAEDNGAGNAESDKNEPPGGDQTAASGNAGNTKPTGPSEAVKPSSGMDGEAGSAAELKTQLDSANEQLANLQAVHAEMKDKERAKQQAEQEKRGEFETLYTDAKTELEKLTPERDRYRSVLDALLEQELSTLPETFDRSLIPEGDPTQQLGWIQKARASGVIKTQSKGDGTVPFSGTQDATVWAEIYKKSTPV